MLGNAIEHIQSEHLRILIKWTAMSKNSAEDPHCYFKRKKITQRYRLENFLELADYLAVLCTSTILLSKGGHWCGKYEPQWLYAMGSHSALIKKIIVYGMTEKINQIRPMQTSIKYVEGILLI